MVTPCGVTTGYARPISPTGNAQRELPVASVRWILASEPTNVSSPFPETVTPEMTRSSLKTSTFGAMN